MDPYPADHKGVALYKVGVLIVSTYEYKQYYLGAQIIDQASSELIAEEHVYVDRNPTRTVIMSRESAITIPCTYTKWRRNTNGNLEDVLQLTAKN